jgi:hypothetical protein
MIGKSPVCAGTGINTGIILVQVQRCVLCYNTNYCTNARNHARVLHCIIPVLQYIYI